MRGCGVNRYQARGLVVGLWLGWLLAELVLAPLIAKAPTGRLGLAWHVLRGRPLMYRLRVREPLALAPRQTRLRVVDCAFERALPEPVHVG